MRTLRRPRRMEPDVWRAPADEEAGVRRARELHADLGRALDSRSVVDQLGIVLVDTTQDPAVAGEVVSALVPLEGADVYDIGGGEVVVVGDRGVDRRVARALRGMASAGVAWGVARWPTDGHDPALLLDMAAERLGPSRPRRRRAGLLLAAGAAAVLVPLAATSLDGGAPAVDRGAKVSTRSGPISTAVDDDETAVAVETVPPAVPQGESAPAEDGAVANVSAASPVTTAAAGPTTTQAPALRSGPAPAPAPAPAPEPCLLYTSPSPRDRG